MCNTVVDTSQGRRLAATGAATATALGILRRVVTDIGDADVKVQRNSSQGMVSIKHNLRVGDISNDHDCTSQIYPQSRFRLPSEWQRILGKRPHLLLISHPVALLGFDNEAQFLPYIRPFHLFIQAGNDISIPLAKGKGPAIVAAPQQGAVRSGERIFDRNVLVFCYHHDAYQNNQLNPQVQEFRLTIRFQWRRANGMKRIGLVIVIGFITPTIAMAQLGDSPSGHSRYESTEAQVAFYYPNEWFVSEHEGSPMVVSRQALVDQLDRDQPDLEPGDTVLTLGVMPTMFMAMMGIPVDSVEGIAEGMFESMIAQSGEVRDGDAETHSFGGRQVASVVFDDVEDEFSGMIAVTHEQEEVIGFGIMLGFREDLLQRRERAARIVSSVEFRGDFSQMLGQ